MRKDQKSETGNYGSGDYWERRSDLLYYRYIDYIMRCVGKDAKSIIDVGSGNCPYLEWFDWIPKKVSVDIRVPYSSETVEGVQGDILRLDFDRRFDVCTCFQVLEHVPEAGRFARRLLELADLVIVSVPYNWSDKPRTPGHIHDPVDYKKLTGWIGREANYRMVVKEPFVKDRSQRLIALYDVNPDRRFGPEVRADRIIRRQVGLGS